MKCSICNGTTLYEPAEHAMQACLACANKVGIQPMPPVTRPPKPCATCGGRKFLRGIPREHSAKGNDYVHEISAPMRLTHAPQGGGLIFKGADAIDIMQGFGSFEIYACYGCGRVEWFCPDVAQVPVHPHLMTDVVDYDSGTPYR